VVMLSRQVDHFEAAKQDDLYALILDLKPLENRFNDLSYTI
jgi:hypothetical protein